MIKYLHSLCRPFTFLFLLIFLFTIACDDSKNITIDNEGEPVFPGHYQPLPEKTTGDLHFIFSGDIGIPYSRSSMGAIDPDPTGHNPSNDYDGDGIPNDQEIITNPFVADYPRIVTRITAPITMEIRISKDIVEDNYTETITSNDLEDTIKNSMENKHYTSANQKTTPYVTKESLSEEGKHADSYGYSNSDSLKVAVNANAEFVTQTGPTVTSKIAVGYGASVDKSKSRSENTSVEDSFAKSTMSEKTVFKDVDYVDNLDKNGVEFSSDTVQRMSSNFRKSTKVKQTDKIGPNDGYVRASLFIKNPTINLPVNMSNVVCTLSFRTPAGTHMPVRTFTLKEESPVLM